MSQATANLRISYLGGGYDFPEFFEHSKVCILAEGLPLSVKCTLGDKSTDFQNVCWQFPGGLGSGLGSSAARHLSFIRVRFPEARCREQIDAGIALDGLQSGGWQDTIAAAHEGVIKIVLHRGAWQVYPMMDMNLALHPCRKLYKIPVVSVPKKILTAMRSRETSFEAMQSLVAAGEKALMRFDLQAFGAAVTSAWLLKKQWHPEISNDVITEMEATAADAGAWGWKVCGAGGQGYLLVIAEKPVHEFLQHHRSWDVLEVAKND